MKTILDVLATLFLTVAIIGAAWFIYGKLVTPVKAGKGQRLFAVVYARGSSPDIGRTAKGLLWLVGSGKVDMDLIIADGGMDAESRKMAELLVRDNSAVTLCKSEDIAKVFAERTEEECLRRGMLN